jgi:hypothetical protein
VLIELLATALPLAVTAAVARVSGDRIERFFTALVGTNGRLARQHPILRMGLGLDDMSYSSWDVLPGLAALGRPLDDPELDARRRTARTWAIAFGIQFFVGIALAIAVSAMLGVSPMIPTLAAFLGWGFSQYVVFRHALWASRPEIRDVQELQTRLYVVTGEVIVVLLLIVGAIVFVALQLRG